MVLHYRTAKNSRNAFAAPALAGNASAPSVEQERTESSPPALQSPTHPPEHKMIIPQHIDFPTFGALVRYLRTSYFERNGHDADAGLQVTLSQMALIRCMEKHGYSTSSGTFSLVEQGKILPQDPETFLSALCACLGIQSTDFYWYLLRHQYGYDHLARATGEDFARQLIPTGTQLAKALTGGQP